MSFLPLVLERGWLSRKIGMIRAYAQKPYALYESKYLYCLRQKIDGLFACPASPIFDRTGVFGI